MAVIVDVPAQFMGSKSQFKTVLYWLPFVYMIFWLAPSVTMLQGVMHTLGTVALFALNAAFFVLLWSVLKIIYKFNTWRMIGLFVVPSIGGIVAIVALVFYATQVLMTVS